MRDILGKLRRIVVREGLQGVVGRLRHTPLRAWMSGSSPVLPRIGDSVQIVDHGYPELATLLRSLLTEWGITDSPVKGAEPLASREPTRPFIRRWHVGMPSKATGDDLVMVVDKAGPHSILGAGLVLDHDASRLVTLSRRFGHSCYLAIPAPGATLAAWDQAIRRVLVFLGRISASEAMDYRPAIQAQSSSLPRLCLGLPEFPDRVAAFVTSPLAKDIPMVEGIRRSPGWLGAAESYSLIARAALELDRDELLICQDDAAPGPDYLRRMEQALHYWRASGADMFSGLVTDVDDTFHVTRVVRYEGMTFVHLNRNIGLVFNIYGRRALARLAAWSRPPDGTRLTIDRHLGAAEDLDVVVCLPYLVRHRGGLTSSIWNFHNDRYDTLIAYSEARLTEMARQHEVGLNISLPSL